MILGTPPKPRFSVSSETKSWLRPCGECCLIIFFINFVSLRAMFR